MKKLLATLLVFFSSQAVAATCPSNFKDIGLVGKLVEKEYSLAHKNRRPITDAAYKMNEHYGHLTAALAVEGSKPWERGPEKLNSFTFMDKNDAKQATTAMAAMAAIAKNSSRFGSLTESLSNLGKEAVALNLYSKELNLAEWRCLSNEATLRALTDGYHNDLKLVPIEEAILTNKEAVLKAAAETAADEETLWGDTILEGDYSLTGDAKAENLEVLYRGDIMVGVSMTINADAIMTGDGDCEFNEETEKWEGEECAHGYIYSNRLIDWELKEVQTPHEPSFDN
jgi:hypothetical protein